MHRTTLIQMDRLKTGFYRAFRRIHRTKQHHSSFSFLRKTKIFVRTKFDALRQRAIHDVTMFSTSSEKNGCSLTISEFYSDRSLSCASRYREERERGIQSWIVHLSIRYIHQVILKNTFEHTQKRRMLVRLHRILRSLILIWMGFCSVGLFIFTEVKVGLNEAPE